MIPAQRIRDRDLSARLIWLLTLTWAGKVYRWSTVPVHPLDSDGAPVPYDGGLDCDGWIWDLATSTTTPEPQAVTLTVDWPGSPGSTIAAGHPLDTAKAELSSIIEGQTLCERVIVAQGHVTRPSYGSDGEPVTLTLEDDPYLDQALIPAATARVSADTVSTAYDDDADGAYYPIVWGEPGALSDGTSIPATPALVIYRANLSLEAQTLRIAGHHVVALQVTVYDSDGASEVFAVANTTDDAGQKVADIDVSGAGTIDLTLSRFWVAWTHGRAMAEVSALGSLLAYLLQQSTIRMDWTRTRPVLLALDAYQTGGYLDDATSPWDAIQDHLLPVLPLSVAAGVEGAYLLRRRVGLTSSHATGRVEVGAGIVRDGPVQYTIAPTDRASEVRLDYAHDAAAGERRRVVSHTGSDPIAGEVSSYHAQQARRQRGEQALALDTEIIYLDDTAQLLASLHLRLAATDGRQVTIAGHIQDLGHYSAGQILELTDPQIGLNNQLCSVVSVSVGSTGEATLVLELDTDPARQRTS